MSQVEQTEANPWLFRGIVWFLASLTTAMIGPFTTYNAYGFTERFAYWGGLIGVGIILGYSVRALILRFRGEEDLVGCLWGTVVQSLTLGPLIWALNLWVLGFNVDGAIWLAEHVLVVFVICLGITILRLRLGTLAGDAAVPEGAASGLSDPTLPTEQDTVSAPAFLSRLDVPVGGQVVWVSANDHYLRVVTDEGEGRLRMRFRDALEMLEPVPGYRVHRSHWVAREALVRVRVDGRRHVAELSCGTHVPVSQGYLDRLRRDGLIDGSVSRRP